jgi:acetylornithine deacetylase/succinyl-diaminopimelate desuccinylase-like protein
LNLRFLIEGEEEVSGPSLPGFVRANAERLKSDYLFIADGLFTAPGQPNLVTGLRGLAGGEIEVTGASADLHSGIYGGVAPNPFHSLVHILAALKGRDGRISIPGFYEAVRPPSENELAAWNRVPVDEETLKRDLGVPALEGEQEYSVHERRWARPTFEIHGIIGGFTGEGVKTVIPARARAKITMRLVPEQDPQRVVDALAEYLPELATPGVKVSFRANESAPAVLAGVEHAGVDAAKRAFQAAFDAEPVLVREGGSIPVATAFQEALHPHMLISGFGLPEDGLHSPNEHFSLDQYHRGTEMVLHLMHNLADGAAE